MHLRPILLLAMPLLLGGCFASMSAPTPPPLAAVTVGRVELERGAPPGWEARLEVGVRVFGNEFSRQQREIGNPAFAEIREGEARYLPYQLRQALTASGQWGAVRVLPEDDPSVDLMVHGAVLQSDGEGLVLRLRARDSSGRLWLDETYRDSASRGDYDSVSHDGGISYDSGALQDPFQDIYNRISNDLLAYRDSLTMAELRAIKEVATLVYAQDLSPDSFARFTVRDGRGRLSLIGLPAESDPMFMRVRDMRRRHHLFIDRVDEYYEALYLHMQEPYLAWRGHSLERELAYIDDQNRELVALNSSVEDSYLALIQRYNQFRWAGIYDEEFTALAVGFSAEVTPAVRELERQVRELSGTMEEQYRQWRRILRRLFEIEAGIED